MISGLCGFAELVRRHGGEVGAGELIDVARAFTLVDLADRHAVERAIRLGVSWSTVEPELFAELFATWFDAAELDPIGGVPGDAESNPDALVELEADMVDAARIHTEDSVAIDDRRDDSAEATAEDGVRASEPAPGRPASDGGTPIGAHGEAVLAPPAGETEDRGARSADVVVALPDAAPDADLELARAVLSAAQQRRRLAIEPPARPSRVSAVAAPLTAAERDALARCARMVNQTLDGAASWRRRAAPSGAVDLRRTMRRSVTAGGVPFDVRRLGRRVEAARLLVLVDVSLSVRGTARLILHLVHRLRCSVGSLRAFGFVDSLVPIDRALRTSDPAQAVEAVLGEVDVEATSDPGRALRVWMARWHVLVTSATHVLILSDGRCNGHDPAYDVVRSITARSASTVWISPEPVGAWSLGRGEMSGYAACVDEAITVRSIDDLPRVPAVLGHGARHSHIRR